MDREPAVAGRFYPADPEALAREVDGFLGVAGGSAAVAGGLARPALGLVAPHAGYVYSGAIAGAVFARVSVPARVLVLGPNHTGLGAPAAVWPGGSWHTPLGTVPVDAELTGALLSGGGPGPGGSRAADSILEPDTGAHRLEHALEVQVPFLRRARPDVAIAALCLSHLTFPDCQRVARVVASATRAAGALLVASSDMSHYLPAEEARVLDARAIERMLALDAEGLFEVVHRERITMCGVIPATVMLLAAVARGARSAELVRYGHSGEVSGDDERVVGYAGIVVR
jgi:AmmeMemoRadiSam system protein B